MRNIRIVLVFLAVCLFTSCEQDTQETQGLPQELSLQALDLLMVMSEQRTLSGTDFEVVGDSFTLAFFDKTTGERVGYLIDINAASGTFSVGSMKAENYAIFELEADNSTFVLHSFIEMTPINGSSGSKQIQSLLPYPKES